MASASASTVLLKSGHFYEEHVKDSKRTIFNKNEASTGSKAKNFGHFGSNFAAADLDKHEYHHQHHQQVKRKVDHDQIRKSFNNYDAVKNEEQNAQPKQASKALGDGQLVGGKKMVHQQSSAMIKSSQEFQSIGTGSKFLNQ
jgi:hypothetical protein